jgi:hypothetical protein
MGKVNSPIYSLVLSSSETEEYIISGDINPLRIHRILTGKSFAKRLKKPGCSAIIKKDGRAISFSTFQSICLNIWLEQAEEINTCKD